MTTQQLSGVRTLRHTPARVTNLETNPNWLAGFHTKWERELHLAEARSTREQAGDLAWRKRVVDDACRKFKQSANDIVSCEVCQETIAQCLLDGEAPFAAGIGIREMLETYGVRIPKLGKLRKSNR